MKNLNEITQKGVILTITTDYRPRADKKYNIRFRITYKGKRKYIPFKAAYTAEEWTSICSTRLKDEELIEKKDSILKEFDVIKDHIKDIVEKENKQFSFELLYRRLGKGDKNSVFAAFVDKIETLRKSGRVGTSVTYKDALGSLWRYVNKDTDKLQFSKVYQDNEWLTKYNNVSFDSITQNWLNGYLKWLRDNGKSDTTAGIYLRNLRAIVNEHGVSVEKYPFGVKKFEIPSGSGRKIALNKDLIYLIDSLQFPTDDNAAKYRDLWLFSYLCNGANLKDIFRLKFKDIKGDIIYFVRAKTEFTSKKRQEIEAAIHPRMKEIIEKWGNENKSSNFIFPFLFDGVTPDEERVIVQDYTKRINRRMELISTALSLNIKITLYSARHSFAVNSERSGQRTSLISKSLGHKDLKTTIDYLGSFNKDEIIENSNNLL